MSTEFLPVNRALISVSDKTGLVEFAEALSMRGVEILSTGGTASLLTENAIKVTEVASFTGFPEIMGGRVKTLHPKIHGGILGRRGIDEDVMHEHGITAIDLVVVNLYPFASAVADPDCSFQQAIENIDIGGPAMVRAAAKNHDGVAVITDPEDYTMILQQLQQENRLAPTTRFELAIKAFSHTASYDGMISNYLSAIASDSESQADDANPPIPGLSADFVPVLSAFPRRLNLQFEKVQDMRYGENPHQEAAFYRVFEEGSRVTSSAANIATAEFVQGKALSYNNIADADAALECVRQFDQPACVIVKHANPCGVAVGEQIQEVYQAAYRCDPTSAFGGILAFNREIDEGCMLAILQQQFVEVILAPSFSPDALQALKSKPSVRALRAAVDVSAETTLRYQSVGGGLLAQSSDQLLISEGGLTVVSRKTPSDDQMRDLVFAWQVAKFVKSNAIVYARDLQTVGIGAGQMSRVYSARIAAIKAADESLPVSGSVMASDAFFPFRDGIDSASDAGISAVIQPGGSKNDQEVIDAVNEHGMAMVFTGMRHFRH